MICTGRGYDKSASLSTRRHRKPIFLASSILQRISLCLSQDLCLYKVIQFFLCFFIFWYCCSSLELGVRVEGGTLLLLFLGLLCKSIVVHGYIRSMILFSVRRWHSRVFLRKPPVSSLIPFIGFGWMPSPKKIQL